MYSIADCYAFAFNGVFNIPVQRIFAAKVIYLSAVASTVLTIINVPYDSVVNAHENMLYYSLIGIFECLLRLAIAFVCVYTNSDKLIVYGVLTAMIPLITLTIMKIYCHRKYDECVFRFVSIGIRIFSNELLHFSLGIS